MQAAKRQNLTIDIIPSGVPIYRFLPENFTNRPGCGIIAVSCQTGYDCPALHLATTGKSGGDFAPSKEYAQYEEYTTHSREETVELGRKLAARLTPGALITFTGGLGAGKTAFCQGIAEGLGCTDPVSSPTLCHCQLLPGSPAVCPF